MSLIIYAPFFKEAKDHEGETLHSEACRGGKLRSDEIIMANAFDVVFNC